MTLDWTIPVIIVQLIFLEGILSIDNATVLGALVITLPADQEVPWPPALKPLGRWLHPILGRQRTAALRVGLLGAYAGQATMLILANYIIQNPWLKLVGAAYLVRLAFDALGAHGGEGAEEEGDVGQRLKNAAFWPTVLTVELMDLAFSLDNVVAAVSLSNKLWVVMIGVAIGVLTMRFAAGKFSYYIERNPVLKTAAYILVLNIGIELILEELGILDLSDLMKFGISIGTILLALAYARFRWLQVFRPALFWLSTGFGIFNDMINWILAPFLGLARFLISKGRTILLPQQP